MRARERGIAVFIAMAAVVILSGVATALVMTTATDVRIAASFRNGLEARYAADAGAARALIDLAAVADWTTILNGSVRSSFVDGPPAGVRPSAGGSTVDLDLVRSLADCGHGPPCRDAERDAVTASRPWGVDNPRWQLFAYGPLATLLPPGAVPSPCYVVVLVADDPGERDGNPGRDSEEPEPGAGVLRLRVEAFGRAGAHRAVEITVARPEPPTPAARVIGWREIP